MDTQRVNGLHHITAIAGPAQENLDFYAGVLGMRLVKKSVNQDDPGTYHLFYADAEGRPGTDLTFFPWAQLAPPRLGHGLAVEVGLEVPSGSLRYWGARLRAVRRPDRMRRKRASATQVLPLTDPHGLAAGARRRRRTFHAPFYALGGQHRCRPSIRCAACTAAACGSATKRRRCVSSRPCSASSASATENGWTRYGFKDVRGRGRRPRNARRAARRVGRRLGAPPRLARRRRGASARRARAGRKREHRCNAGDRSLLVQVRVFPGAGRRALRARDRRSGVRRR